MSGARNKPSVKAVANLVQVGVHSDGGSLYLRVRPAIEGVTRAWVFVLTVGGKRCEYGLGSAMVKPVHPVEKFTSMAPGVPHAYAYLPDLAAAFAGLLAIPDRLRGSVRWSMGCNRHAINPCHPPDSADRPAHVQGRACRADVIGRPRGPKASLVAGVTDMRKGFDALAAYRARSHLPVSCGVTAAQAGKAMPIAIAADAIMAKGAGHAA